MGGSLFAASTGTAYQLPLAVGVDMTGNFFVGPRHDSARPQAMRGWNNLAGRQLVRCSGFAGVRELYLAPTNSCGSLFAVGADVASELVFMVGANAACGLFFCVRHERGGHKRGRRERGRRGYGGQIFSWGRGMTRPGRRLCGDGTPSPAGSRVIGACA